MAELIDIYTEDGIKTGAMPKKEYYSIKGNNIPWINCATCFVIDEKTKKILFEKRGNRFLDPGKLDLCSGHIKSGELPFQGMIRELKEELSIPEEISSSIKQLGSMKVDYTSLKDETNRKNLKCFVSIYALKMRDTSMIKIDNKEAINIGWLNIEDTIGFIQNSMTRMPYEENLEKQYSEIFDNLKLFIYSKEKNNERIK